MYIVTKSHHIVGHTAPTYEPFAITDTLADATDLVAQQLEGWRVLSTQLPNGIMNINASRDIEGKWHSTQYTITNGMYSFATDLQYQYHLVRVYLYRRDKRHIQVRAHLYADDLTIQKTIIGKMDQSRLTVKSKWNFLACADLADRFAHKHADEEMFISLTMRPAGWDYSRGGWEEPSDHQED